MKLNKLIQFVRGSCIVQDPNNVTQNDPNFLNLTDEEIIDILQVMLCNINSASDIRNIDQEDVYPVVLLTKKEIYSRLAIKNAPKVSMKSSGDSLDFGRKFDHYMELVESVNKEYSLYLSTGRPIEVSEVFLESRYFSSRSYNNATPPVINLYVDNVGDNFIEVSWKLSYIRYKSKFKSYTVYYTKSDNIIFDEYNQIINENANKIIVNDIHTNKCRITGLVPNTEYNICIVAEEFNGLKGIYTDTVKTGGV